MSPLSWTKFFFPWLFPHRANPENVDWSNFTSHKFCGNGKKAWNGRCRVCSRGKFLWNVYRVFVAIQDAQNLALCQTVFACISRVVHYMKARLLRSRLSLFLLMKLYHNSSYACLRFIWWWFDNTVWRLWRVFNADYITHSRSIHIFEGQAITPC